MKKNVFSLCVVLIAVVLGACCCKCTPRNDPNSEPDEEQTSDSTIVEQPDLSLLKLSVPVTENWIYSGKPAITIRIENPNKAAVKVEAKIKLVTDTWQPVGTIADSVTVAGATTQDFVMTTSDNLSPGFYRATCVVNGKLARAQFMFGIDPFDIVSAPDKQPDFDDFWATAKAQLDTLDMHAQLTEITTKSTAARKVYLVEMHSVPDGLTGEPVTIRGYYCEPQDGQQHPVIMHFYGYDTQGSKSKCECPDGGSSAEFAEFYLSHRGQYLNNRPASTQNLGVTEDCVNIYGDWFAYHFGDKDSYYYRGAFMDCVQAVRFMATRQSSDMTRLFGEGSSQGGALSYAAAALSDYPFTAIAPNVAFLGDYPDYFRIVSWPAETAKANKGTMTDEQMYAFLSYFDTKNLATRISCGVLATSGLQDGTCPPHTNIAPYNNLLTPADKKEYHFYPEMQHAYPTGWNGMIRNFFRSFL